MNTGIRASMVFFALLAASSATAQGIKWHPGHYVTLAGNDSLAQHLAQIDELGAESAVKGVQVRIWWHQLEPTKGVYDFSLIDAYLNRLKAQPTAKRLVVRIMERRFNTSSQLRIVPDYLRYDPLYKGGLVQTSTGYAARLWEPLVMNRLIALYQAIGKRYDTEARFEGVASEETTLSLASFPAGYSHAALKDQYCRLANAVRAAMPSTNFFLYTNWIGSADLMSSLIQDLTVPAVAASGPDVIPDAMTLGQKVWTGVYGADYRGTLALASSVETGELGGNLGDYTPQQINDFAYNTLYLSHIFWIRNTWAGDSSQRWHTGILPFLRTKPPFRGRCPSSYGVCLK
jgi:hypothetical protein